MNLEQKSLTFFPLESQKLKMNGGQWVRHLQQMFYGINKKMLHSPHHAQIMKNK